MGGIAGVKLSGSEVQATQKIPGLINVHIHDGEVGVIDYKAKSSVLPWKKKEKSSGTTKLSSDNATNFC